MKKILSALAFMLVLWTPTYAVPTGIDFIVGIDEPLPGIPGHGKSPVHVPIVMQDSYEITFTSSHPVYTLYIVEDDVVVYSVIVSSTTTSVLLPSWLSGDYVLYLQPEGSSYYFYADITL